MKITNFDIKNKFINYKNLQFDFSQCGIYKISGENGAGKTTAMEQIVFGKYDAEFENVEFAHLWSTERYSLFTYVPQNIVDINVSVGNYICKGNKTIQTSAVFALFDLFKLSKDIVNKKFRVLSGGEKKKIQIISGLLKDTPYLFLDEPTNNLDNEAVECLNQLLKDLERNKTIVLISHDDRLDCQVIKEYHLSGTQMVCTAKEQISRTATPLQQHSKINQKPHIFRTIFPILKNYAQIVTLCVFCFALVFAGVYSNMEFQNNLSDLTPVAENMILLRGSTVYDEELLSYYLKGEKITIDDSKKDKYVDLNDVYTDIVKLPGIDTIYITDVKYQTEIEKQIIDGTIGEELHYVSCPKEYVTEFWKYCSLDYGIDMLVGAFPRDGQDEIAISKNLLKTHFNYSDTQIDNSIGTTLRLSVGGEEKDYKIVGHTYFDYILISYEADKDFGVYCYDESTYEEFGLAQIEFEQERDGWVGMVSEMLILTKQGYEGSIFNHLLTHYPAGLFYSHHYDVVWTKAYNMKHFNDLLVPNIIIAVALSATFILINHYAIKYNLVVLWDYGNHFINRKKIKRIYYIVSIAIYIIVILASILLNSLISTYAYLSNWYLVIDSAIIIVPLIISYFIRKKKRK